MTINSNYAIGRTALKGLLAQTKKTQSIGVLQKNSSTPCLKSENIKKDEKKGNITRKAQIQSNKGLKGKSSKKNQIVSNGTYQRHYTQTHMSKLKKPHIYFYVPSINPFSDNAKKLMSSNTFRELKRTIRYYKIRLGIWYLCNYRLMKLRIKFDRVLRKLGFKQ